MPTVAVGREAPVSSVPAELEDVLIPYRLRPEQLPKPLLDAIQRRSAFTLAEGAAPKDI